jgi:hypothetical protein
VRSNHGRRVYVISTPLHSGTVPKLRKLVAIIASADA